MARDHARKELQLSPAWAAAGALAALYLAFPSRAYVFEGLARAMPVELGRLPDLLNANHLLYGPLGFCFHRLLGLLGIHPLAVHSLQALDALLGGAGLLVFAAILRRAGADRRSAGVWTAVLGTSFGYWAFSSEAENYIFSTLLLQVLFLRVLRYREGKGSPVELGLFHALAVGGHVVNLVFVLPIAWGFVSRHGPRWKNPFFKYAATVVGVVLLVYTAAWFFMVEPAGRYDAASWLLGSASGGARGYPSAYKLWLWLKTSGNAFVSYRIPWLLLPVVAALAVSARRVKPVDRTLAAGAAAWLIAYALVFTTWEPHTLVYRVSDLPPAVLLLFLVCRGSMPVGAALAVLLGVGNFAADILPRSNPANNPHLALMESVRAHTTERDWVAAGGGRDELYLPYFAQRRPLVYGRYSKEELAVVIGRIQARGETVYAMPSAVAELAAYKPVRLGLLYRLGPKKR